MKIEKANNQGYIWYSDEDFFRIVDGEFELDIADEANPFVVEGQLYDAANQRSISIKYVDGRYLCQTYDIQKLTDEYSEEKYMANTHHRTNDEQSQKKGLLLKFRHYWKAVSDNEFVNHFPVLQPAEMVFMGFATHKKEEEQQCQR